MNKLKLMDDNYVRKNFDINSRSKYQGKEFLEIFDKNVFTKYLCNLNKKYFVVFNGSNKAFILNRDGDVVIDDEIVEKFPNKYLLYKFEKYVQKYNGIVIYLLFDGVCEKPNLIKIDKELVKINKKLKEKCKDLSLTFKKYDIFKASSIKTYKIIDDVYKLELYNKKRMISEIKLVYQGVGMMEIRSFTKPKFRGKSYNKMLRILMVILLALLICEKYGIRDIYSQAINPISAYVLMNNFKVIYNITGLRCGKRYFNNNKLETRELVEKLYKKSDTVHIFVKLSKYNIKRAIELLNIMLSDGIDAIKC
jgi:hypothetical protein